MSSLYRETLGNTSGIKGSVPIILPLLLPVVISHGSSSCRRCEQLVTSGGGGAGGKGGGALSLGFRKVRRALMADDHRRQEWVGRRGGPTVVVG
jgi:hypothetical protein